LPIDVARLPSSQFVACVIAKPEVPPLIVEARRRGCRTMAGAGIFDARAEILGDFLLEGVEQAAWREKPVSFRLLNNKSEGVALQRRQRQQTPSSPLGG